ncbi:hypothetical protein MBLNU13_g07821t1 [Cladosporium sp. NU13]
MGSFRKRISKRSTEPSEDKKEVSSIAKDSSKFFPLRTPKTTSEDNMDLTSPPPPPSVLPRKPEKTLCSPSKSLLHRLQNRNSMDNSTTGSRPSKKLAMTSPAPLNVTTRSRSKVPSFTENFEHSKFATEFTAPPKVASTTSISSATQTVGGVEFEMVNSLQPPPGQPIRSKSAEPTRGRSDSANAKDGDSMQFRRKRESRSETREARADSTIGDYDDDDMKAKEATAEVVSLKTEKPRLKSILKKSKPVAEPNLKIPRVTRSTAATDPAKNTNTTTTKKSIKLVEGSSDSSDCEFILDNKNGTAPNVPQRPEHKIKPTRVIPPAYIKDRLPGLVWCSKLSSTSRPDYPWLWNKRWTCCRCSATTIVEQQKLDAKAYSRASQASYVLKKYDVAAKYCWKMLDLKLDRVYDIANIQDSVSRQHRRVDAADYLGDTVVQVSGPNRGRGLFATRSLKAEDLILAETAFASVWDDKRAHVIAAKWNARFPKDIHMGLIGLWKIALQRVQNNPILGCDLLDLHGSHNELGDIVAEVDGVQVVDTYHVYDIVSRNAFQLVGPFGTEKHCSGIYIRSSYVNHSCVPNAHRTFIGEFLLLYATKDIKKGEELTISYGPDLVAFVSRREAIMSMWNFQCECALCVADAGIPTDVLEKRDALAKAAESFMKPEQCARDIAATYDNNSYCSLPRSALIDIQSWLVDATITCRNVKKSRRSIPNLLRSLGYNVDVRNGSIERILPTTNSILAEPASRALWDPLVGTALRRRFSGDVHVAAHLAEFVKAWDRIMHGSNANAVEAFNDQPNMNIEYRARIAAMNLGMARMSM